MLERLTATPFQDEEVKQRGWLLNIMILGSGILVALGLILGIAHFIPAEVTVAEGAFLLILAICYALSRRGQLDLAIYLFLVSLAVFGAALPLLPTIPPSVFLIVPYFFSFIVVASGKLLAIHSPFVFATLTTVLLLIVIVIRGGLSAADMPETKMNEALYLAVALPMNYVLAALSWLYGQDAFRMTTRLKQRFSVLEAQLATNETLVKEIIGAAERLDFSTNGLLDLTGGLYASVEQVVSAVQQIAQSAQVQIEKAESISQSLSQMATATKQISANAKMGEENCAQLQEILEESAKVLQDLDVKTEEIEKIAELVKKFADRWRQRKARRAAPNNVGGRQGR
ncbi:MAG: hypothetical protein U9R11_04450 [Chloroflexota bacterium]|nr:hypothetical protein [Chloroflexota bacterium]